MLTTALIAADLLAQPPLTPDGQSAFDSALVNPAFRDLDDEEISRFEPIADERFLKRSRASRYRQHRLVAIDAEAFKKQLLDSWQLYLERGYEATTVIPLFEDHIAEIVVADWIKVGNGFEGIAGYVRESSPGGSTVWIYFDPTGGVKTVIRQPARSFLIERLDDTEIYFVLSLDPLPEGMSFE